MQKKNKTFTLLPTFKVVIQLIAFILIPGLFTTTFYAMKAVYLAVINNQFNLVNLASPLLILTGTILVTILLGRFFCGFLCSFGAMGDLLWYISSKTFKFKFKVSERLDKFLKLFKYVILLFIVLGLWTFEIWSLDSLSSPWSIFGMYTAIGNWPSFTYLISIGGFLLLLIMLGSLFIERFFCRYLCPLGGVFAIISRFRVFRIHKNREKCGACRICTNNCPMGIPLYRYDVITSGECIDCFNCVNSCPRQNVKANPKPVIVSSVSIASIVGLAYIGNVVASQDTNEVSEISFDKTETGQYVDGVYTGIANGFRGEIEVSVTVLNGNIVDITTISYSDDDEYFTRAQNTIFAEVLNKQDVDVDSVTGATFSSEGIIQAIANALSIKQEVIVDEPEEDVVNDDSNSSLAVIYEDGSYTGLGTGYRGEIEVEVNVSDGKIVDITVLSYVDDQQYFTKAETSIIADIIANQDVDVDTVSGATFSSQGILEAVSDAIGLTYENTNTSSNFKKHQGK